MKDAANWLFLLKWVVNICVWFKANAGDVLASHELEKRGAFVEEVIRQDTVTPSLSLTAFLCDTEHVTLRLIPAAFSLIKLVISLKLLKRRYGHVQQVINSTDLRNLLKSGWSARQTIWQLQPGVRPPPCPLSAPAGSCPALRPAWERAICSGWQLLRTGCFSCSLLIERWVSQCPGCAVRLLSNSVVISE